MTVVGCEGTSECTVSVALPGEIFVPRESISECTWPEGEVVEGSASHGRSMYAATIVAVTRGEGYARARVYVGGIH